MKRNEKCRKKITHKLKLLRFTNTNIHHAKIAPFLSLHGVPGLFRTYEKQSCVRPSISSFRWRHIYTRHQVVEQRQGNDDSIYTQLLPLRRVGYRDIARAAQTGRCLPANSEDIGVKYIFHVSSSDKFETHKAFSSIENMNLSPDYVRQST